MVIWKFNPIPRYLERTRKKFLFFPRKFNEELRWLEFVIVRDRREEREFLGNEFFGLVNLLVTIFSCGVVSYLVLIL